MKGIRIIQVHKDLSNSCKPLHGELYFYDGELVDAMSVDDMKLYVKKLDPKLVLATLSSFPKDAILQILKNIMKKEAAAITSILSNEKREYKTIILPCGCLICRKEAVIPNEYSDYASQVKYDVMLSVYALTMERIAHHAKNKHSLPPPLPSQQQQLQPQRFLSGNAVYTVESSDGTDFYFHVSYIKLFIEAHSTILKIELDQQKLLTLITNALNSPLDFKSGFGLFSSKSFFKIVNLVSFRTNLLLNNQSINNNSNSDSKIGNSSSNNNSINNDYTLTSKINRVSLNIKNTISTNNSNSNDSSNSNSNSNSNNSHVEKDIDCNDAVIVDKLTTPKPGAKKSSPFIKNSSIPSIVKRTYHEIESNPKIPVEEEDSTLKFSRVSPNSSPIQQTPLSLSKKVSPSTNETGSHLLNSPPLSPLLLQPTQLQEGVHSNQPTPPFCSNSFQQQQLQPHHYHQIWKEQQEVQQHFYLLQTQTTQQKQPQLSNEELHKEILQYDFKVILKKAEKNILNSFTFFGIMNRIDRGDEAHTMAIPLTVEYTRFMLLMAMDMILCLVNLDIYKESLIQNERILLQPSPLVEKMLSYHLIDNENYHIFCRLIFSQFPNSVSGKFKYIRWNPNLKFDDQQIQRKRYLKTLQLYGEFFQKDRLLIDTFEKIWPSNYLG